MLFWFFIKEIEMNKLLVIAAILALGLAGCNPHTSEVSANFVVPRGLQDCQFYKMEPGGLSNSIMVVRCPRSDTATQQTQSCGKGCSRNVRAAVTEGNEIRDSPYEQQ